MEVMENITWYLDRDPYLAYQPSFAKSLPVQLFVNGITITLLIVLLFHLLLTTQYHYPLAPLNYCLQLISILVVVISVIVKTWATLKASADNASYWPYDLDYIAALNNAFANITHIQFLTLLYPSRLEARLIIFILGPLAIAASGLVFTALSGNQTVLDITDSIRNCINSTLLLIFTIALALWGFLVNRRRAWRTDGGTAVFGVGALMLAVVSTSCNFVEVAEDGIEWLQHLLFAAILWQTWLGWWWWVGTGMGIGEVEDLMERAERKKRKNARRAARQRAEQRMNSAASAVAGVNPPGYVRRHSSLAGIVDAGQASANAMAGFTSSVTSILRNRSGTLSRRHRRMSGDVEDGSAGTGGVELDVMGNGDIHHSPISESNELAGDNMPRTNTATSHIGHSGASAPSSPSRVEFDVAADRDTRSRQETSNSETSSTSATPSLHPPKTIGQLLSFPTLWLQVYLRRLQKAHQEAARKQVLQRADVRAHVQDQHNNRNRPSMEAGPSRISGDLDGDGDRPIALPEPEGAGWGLGSFGIKEHQESARRLQEARERLREDRLLTPVPDDPDAAQVGPSRPRRAEGAGADGADGGAVGDEDDWEDVDTGTSSSSSGAASGAGAGNKRNRKGKRRGDKGGRGGAGGNDRDDDTGGGGAGGGRRSGGGGGSGWSWWGPLKEWRLADKSVF